MNTHKKVIETKKALMKILADNSSEREDIAKSVDNLREAFYQVFDHALEAETSGGEAIIKFVTALTDEAIKESPYQTPEQE